METQICFKCKKELPYDMFYKHKQMARGILGKCKECAIKDSHIRRECKIDEIRKYDRERGSRKERIEYNKKMQACGEYKNLYTDEEIKKIREKINKNKKKYKITHRKEVNCRRKLKYAINTGKIIKPDICSICEKHDKIYGHHVNYDEPLNVIWVCDKCHKHIHKQINEEKRVNSEATTEREKETEK